MLRTSSLVLASVVLAGVSGCGPGNSTGGTGSGGEAGATASSSTGSGGAGGEAATTGTGGAGGVEDACANGKKDSTETDKDCGGVCSPCDDGKGCGDASDCVSHVCGPGGACSAPTCSDATKNGAETDVDCGGVCLDCATTQGCSVGADCQSGICKASACVDHHIWSKRFGDSVIQYPRRIAVDSGGNVVVLGYFTGSIDFGLGVLKNPCVLDPQDPLSCNKDYFLVRFDSAGNAVWSKRFLNDNDIFTSNDIDFSLDGTDSIYLATHGTGSFDLGGGALPDTTPCAMGCDVDAAVVKLSSSGAFQWGKRFSKDGDQLVRAVAGKKTSGAAIIGDFNGTVNFGGATLTSQGGHDVFVASFDSAGNHVWSKSFGDASTFEKYGRAIAVDTSGNTLIAGSFRSGIDFGGGNLPSPGSSDLFLAKLDSAGGHVWSKRFGDVQDQSGVTDSLSIAVDLSGNTFLVGQLRSAVDFGNGVLSSPSGKDFFVAKFDPAGVAVWSKKFGTPSGSMSPTNVYDVAVDPLGNVIFTGEGNATVDFGGGPLIGGFLVKLDPSGAHVWSKAFSGRSVATDGTKAIALTGWLFGTRDFGGGPLVSAGSTDVVVAKFVNP